MMNADSILQFMILHGFGHVHEHSFPSKNAKKFNQFFDD